MHRLVYVCIFEYQIKKKDMKTKIGYQGETFESLRKQLEYVEFALSHDLEKWEAKEYESVKKELLFKLSHDES